MIRLRFFEIADDVIEWRKWENFGLLKGERKKF